MSEQRSLMINGSPRARKSNSRVLASHLGVRMLSAGWESETITAVSAMRTEDGRAGLRRAFDTADSVVIVAPLYVDALPGQLTEALEMLAEHATEPEAPGTLAAVLNCGFPEARQNEFAIRICRHFAEAVGREWLGAVSIGGGALIGGKPLDVAGRFGREVIDALDVLAEAVQAGEPLPVDATETVVNPPMSPRMYALGGDMMWRGQAIKQGTLLKLGARPYAEPEA